MGELQPVLGAVGARDCRGLTVVETTVSGSVTLADPFLFSQTPTMMVRAESCSGDRVHAGELLGSGGERE